MIHLKSIAFHPSRASRSAQKATTCTPDAHGDHNASRLHTLICSDCTNLVIQINTRPKSSIKGITRWRTGYYEFAWKTVQQLLDGDAYQKCDLCKALVAVVTLDRLNECLRTIQETEEPILVQPLHTDDIWANMCDLPKIIYWATFILPQNFQQIRFPIWRELDSERIPLNSPTLGNDNTEPQSPSRQLLAETESLLQSPEGVSWAKAILDPSRPTLVAQIRTWLWGCVSDHPKCRTALSGEIFGLDSQDPSLDASKLPFRVIDVGPPGSLLVKLVQTTTETPRAPYVALSHCWGPPDKQPLKTKLDTVQDHIHSGIPLDRLPQTFADAVWVTRELGIRYLWIDSLCIVQDNASDWETESQKMGFIYEGATLILGAAHARDSSEGLFKGLQRPDPKKVVKVYTDMAPYATCFYTVPEWPYVMEFEPWNKSRLSTRAWVMQEFTLSRRFVWSEKNSLHWRCREEMEGEPHLDTYYFDMIRSFGTLTSIWHYLVDDYCGKQLTYETDRLAALHGIATALKTSYRKDQEYHFGIWLEGHDTLLTLFWSVENLFADSPATGLTGIPSWSWASVAGSKRFGYRFTGKTKPLYCYDDRGITAKNNGTELHFRAPIGVVQLCVNWDYHQEVNLARRKGATSTTRYRRMSIYVETPSSEMTGSAETASNAVRFGRLTLDYTIDVSSCPPPSDFTHHVIPLIRFADKEDRRAEYMLVVEPATKADGSKAYRRVGIGFIRRETAFITTDRAWSCWDKLVSEMKTEDIVLV
ncbi:heterokaryon incompatibility protein domain-containing protein [Neurospora intermedia]|uniref:Heterokaryon incompatibility protein domain-containing protein n=1 Tax=Neurospora intermedia TaxID=5142 RepID=A0ABR3D0I9_NEUIN